MDNKQPNTLPKSSIRNIKQSEADTILTNTLSKAVQLLNFKLLDHLIISPEEFYYSFADDGIIE